MVSNEPKAVQVLRIGAIGLDSSHAVQFSRRINGLHAQRITPCRVTCCWDSQHAQPHLPPQAASDAISFDPMEISHWSSLPDLLATVDGVMVLTVDGNRHFDLAALAFERGIPVFIDKPLTCSSLQAERLLEIARTRNARCYSASALRFVDPPHSEALRALGSLTSIEVSAPFQEHPQMPGLWYYACHAFELLDSLWPHVGRVRRVHATRPASGHRILLEYEDGRTAVIGLDRDGTAPFRARLRGTRSAFEFVADLTHTYDRLVASICRFFEGHQPVIPLKNVTETIRSMECCHRSLAQSGEWVDLAPRATACPQNHDTPS